MKNKKTVYILLVAVLAIWSLIIIRFFSIRDQNDNSIIRPQISRVEASMDKTSIEYELLLNYDDPFLTKKNEIVKKRTIKSTGQESINRRAKNKPVTTQQKAPLITYNGMLSNASTGKKVGFLITARKEYMVEAGDVIKDLKIVELWNDSVRVEWNKQTYDIKRNSD